MTMSEERYLRDRAVSHGHKERGTVDGISTILKKVFSTFHRAWLRFLKKLLSGILITAFFLFFFVSFSEVIMYFLDNLWAESSYQDWYYVPLLPFIASVISLSLFLLINYDRIGPAARLVGSLKGRKPTNKDEIELPEFD